MLACFAGHLDIVKHLRIFGATWQSQDVSGCTPLHWAVDGGHLPVVAFMIEDGCEVSIDWFPFESQFSLYYVFIVHKQSSCVCIYTFSDVFVCVLCVRWMCGTLCLSGLLSWGCQQWVETLLWPHFSFRPELTSMSETRMERHHLWYCKMAMCKKQWFIEYAV